MQQSLAAMAALIENTAPEAPAPAPAPGVVELDGQNHVLASAERVREALEVGGRAALTIRSLRTGAHVKVTLVARKKRESGEGWVPRTHTAGRVGIGEATAIEARDPEREYPDNYVGRFYLDTGEWRAGRDADGARVWAAEKVIAYALAGAQLANSEVFLATQCAICGHKLDDPTSIERGIGPECYGRATGSRHARYEGPRR